MLINSHDHAGDVLLGLATVCALVWAAALLLQAWIKLHLPTNDETDVVSVTQLQRYVRKHSPSGGYYQDPINLTTDQTYFFAKPVANHWALNNEPWRHSEHPESAPQVGRHGANSMFRTVVGAGWMPPIGDRRSHLIGDRTQEIPGWLRNIPQWS